MLGGNTLEFFTYSGYIKKHVVYQLIISRRYIFMSRRLSKVFCLFLSMVLAFGLSTTAFAEENNNLSLQI